MENVQASSDLSLNKLKLLIIKNNHPEMLDDLVKQIDPSFGITTNQNELCSSIGSFLADNNAGELIDYVAMKHNKEGMIMDEISKSIMVASQQVSPSLVKDDYKSFVNRNFAKYGKDSGISYSDYERKVHLAMAVSNTANKELNFSPKANQSGLTKTMIKIGQTLGFGKNANRDAVFTEILSSMNNKNSLAKRGVFAEAGNVEIAHAFVAPAIKYANENKITLAQKLTARLTQIKERTVKAGLSIAAAAAVMSVAMFSASADKQINDMAVDKMIDQVNVEQVFVQPEGQPETQSIQQLSNSVGFVFSEDVPEQQSIQQLSNSVGFDFSEDAPEQQNIQQLSNSVGFDFGESEPEQPNYSFDLKGKSDAPAQESPEPDNKPSQKRYFSIK